MNWDDLKYALEIHREGSLSAAARRLGVNHATVSRRLKSFETQLKSRLFERSPQGLQLTEVGHHIIQAAEKMEEQLFALDVSLLGQDKALRGALKVSAPALIIQHLLAPMVKDFLARYPEIDISFVATLDAVNLYRREADVALYAGDHPQESLWGRKIAGQNGGIYGSKDYLSGYQQSDVLSCLNFAWRGDVVDREISRLYDNSRVVAHFDDMGAVVGAVRAGLGVARMPCFIGDAHDDLMRLEGTELAPYYDLWLLTHPDLRHVRRIQVFMRFIAEHFNQQHAYLLGQEKRGTA